MFRNTLLFSSFVIYLDAAKQYTNLADYPFLYFRRADLLKTGRGDAAAATWIFRGGESWRGDIRSRPARMFSGTQRAITAAPRRSACSSRYSGS